MNCILWKDHKPQSKQPMKRTQHALTSLIKLVTCAILALGVVVQAQDKKVDPTGTWTWTSPGRNGGPERKSTLKLKLEGDKVTGSVSAPGRDGQASDVAIADGKLKGDEVSFTVTREFNGNKFTAKYSGKINGDAIKGKVETERDGNAQSRDWEAKREVEKK
jgi:hypothetical protein